MNISQCPISEWRRDVPCVLKRFDQHGGATLVGHDVRVPMTVKVVLAADVAFAKTPQIGGMHLVRISDFSRDSKGV